jgi:ABC-type branched-subunit amino acid transport system permease subunit
MSMTADYVFASAIVLMAALSLYFSPRIAQDRIAMQWGFDGKPTWFAPKPLGVWGLIVFALVVRALIWAAITWIPHLVHGADLAIMLIAVTVVVSHLFVLLRASKGE